MDLPTRLREARTRAGLKQGQVARTLLCSAKRLQNWERGKYQPPNMEAYRSLAKVYGVPVRALLGEVPLPPPPELGAYHGPRTGEGTLGLSCEV